MNRGRAAFALFVAAVGSGAIIGGFATIEPKWAFEAEGADRQRQNDVMTIAHAISLFEMHRKALPYDLAKLSESLTDGTVKLTLRDRETDEPYDYERVDARLYKLCLSFDLDSLPMPPSAANATTNDPWRHSAGLTCFLFDGSKPTPAPISPAAEAKS